MSKDKIIDRYLAHELIDRLYLITDMYTSYICEHPSYVLLPLQEREELRDLLWQQYQKAAEKASEIIEKEGIK